MINYTIIIPHKDIPNLLKRCINSIPERKDLEIIIIDDNSDSSIVNFKQFPGSNRNNTHIILTKEGKGAGYARNIGLKHATGEWIIFADADDCFLSTINSIFDHLSLSKADIVYFDICSKDSENLLLNNESKEHNKSIKEGNSNIKFKIEVPWGKAYKKEFIEQNGLCFEEIMCSNDTRFSVLGDFYAKYIEVIPVIGYCWMTRKQSLWHTQTVKSLRTRMKVMLRLYQFMISNNKLKLAELYYSKAYMFLTKLKELSIREFPFSLLVFGWYIRSPRIILIDFPKTFVYVCLQRFRE